MTETDKLAIEVALATPQAQRVAAFQVVSGSTVGSVLALPEVRMRFPELDAMPPPRVGVWGRACDAARLLRDGDRIEIYRPLQADPKDARRQRAARR